jgi:small subunit ribosomal protein S24e
LDLKITQEEYNALLKRKEIHAEIEHGQAGTPSRVDLRKAVASKYGVKPESVYVINVHTGTGSQSALCEVQVYDDQEGARKIVPKYIQTRNLPPEERKRVREEEAKKAEPKPKAEKPKEKKEDKPKTEAKPPPETAKKEKEAVPK